MPPRDEQGRFKAPDTAHPYLRGKTAEEILAITERLIPIAEASLTRQTQPAVGQPGTEYRPGTPHPNTQMTVIRDEDYATGRDLRGYVDQAAHGFDSRFQELQEATASAILASAKQTYPDEFRRWGSEILAIVAGVPLLKRTLDTYAQAVKMVRGEHVRELADELAAERVSQLTANYAPPMRSNGSAGGPAIPPTQDPLASVADHEWRAKAQRLGIDYETVREFCAKSNTDLNQYLARLGAKAITAPSEMP